MEVSAGGRAWSQIMDWMQCGWRRWWGDIYSPQARSILFTLACEDVVAVFILDDERVFVQVSGAVSVAEFAKANQVVLKAGHDVSRSGRVRGYGWDGKLGRGAGRLGFPGGGADGGARRGGVKMRERGRAGEVVIRGAGIRDGGCVG